MILQYKKDGERAPLPTLRQFCDLGMDAQQLGDGASIAPAETALGGNGKTGRVFARGCNALACAVDAVGEMNEPETQLSAVACFMPPSFIWAVSYCFVCFFWSIPCGLKSSSLHRAFRRVPKVSPTTRPSSLTTAIPTTPQVRPTTMTYSLTAYPQERSRPASP
jgi:hypothetical protein